MIAAPGTPRPLEGLSVLITRPQHQAGRLAQAIEAAGGDPVVFPTIEIQPITENSALRETIERLSDFQIAIFVSANAVEQGMPYVNSVGGRPESLAFAAVGQATSKALRTFGVDRALVPAERFDSEGLLDLPEMQHVAGKRIVIFRGEGGRETLAQTLRARGAMVEYAVCYRRVRPYQDIGPLQSRWQAGNIHAVSAMSLESLTNLYDILDGPTRRLLVATPVFVPHPRIAKAAQTMGLTDVRITGITDDDLIKELSAIHAG